MTHLNELSYLRNKIYVCNVCMYSANLTSCSRNVCKIQDTFAYPFINLHILLKNTSSFKSIGVPFAITLAVSVQAARYLNGFFVTFSFNSSGFWIICWGYSPWQWHQTPSECFIRTNVISDFDREQSNTGSIIMECLNNVVFFSKDACCFRSYFISSLNFCYSFIRHWVTERVRIETLVCNTLVWLVYV